MKKLSVLLIAGLIALVHSKPATAFENEFGGFWRTRFYTQIGYNGTDNSNYVYLDENITDTRTRIYYTAKFSENLEFVNKFEVNATWGGNGGYGQMGADNSGADTFRVKNSYVGIKLGEQLFRVGVQDFLLARGYIYNDDAAGIIAIFKVNDGIYLPFAYMKMYEGGAGYSSTGNSNSNFDMSSYVFAPAIFLDKDNSFKSHVAYITSQNGSAAQAKNSYVLADYNFLASGAGIRIPGTKVDLWSAGLEYDGKIGIFNQGATVIFQFGDIKLLNGENANAKGYLFDLFGGVNLGPANIHAKGIYASGKKYDDMSYDMKQFITFGPKTDWGTSYYWAEIMGAGIIDNTVPSGAPGDKISNVWIGNIGASYKLLADLKFAADLWYAQHVEDVLIITQAGAPYQYSSDLGWELDLVATYTIVDNLKLDLIGAYLWAGDCITHSVDPNGSTNPIELAAQLSLSF
jgi:hypothetical protein